METKVGFIGLGAMGNPMARNLVKKGYPLHVFDIATEKMQSLLELGAEPGASAKHVAQKTDVVITMVPASFHVKEAILGRGGVLEGGRRGYKVIQIKTKQTKTTPEITPPISPVNAAIRARGGVRVGGWRGSIVIDMSTIDPMTTREVAAALSREGVPMLDAPVARAVPAAVAGTLAIFVGGDRETFEKCQAVFGAMETDIHYVGDSGAGEVVEIVNNLIVAIELAAVSEALVLGVKAGVNPEVLFKALGAGSANSFVLQNHIKNCTLKGKFEKGVFPVDYVLKDLGLAMAIGAKYHVPLYFGAVATQAYELAGAAGYSDRYGPVVIKPLEQLTGVEVRGDVPSG